MDNIELIKSEEIEAGLKETSHLYLTGLLERPNSVDEIHKEYEVGMSYSKKFRSKEPHCHLANDEWTYVLEGKLKVLLLDKMKEYEFFEGDFFIIRANTPFAVKFYKKTKVLFSKYPGGNDKVILPTNEKIERWSKKY